MHENVSEYVQVGQVLILFDDELFEFEVVLLIELLERDRLGTYCGRVTVALFVARIVGDVGLVCVQVAEKQICLSRMVDRRFGFKKEIRKVI